MTRKDYELIAKAANSYFRYIDAMMTNGRNDHLRRDNEMRLNGAEFVMIGIAQSLAQENPRFDRARFLAAATMTESKKAEILGKLGA